MAAMRSKDTAPAGAGAPGLGEEAGLRGPRREVSNEFRTEHDSMGEVRVPASAKWGAQTQRAVDNFPISGLRIERALIGALATLKGIAATVNGRLKTIDKDVAAALH